MIIASVLGETKQFISIVNKANLEGKISLFSRNSNSTLAKMADATIVIQAPSKRHEDSSLHVDQFMASLFEQKILISSDAIVLTMTKDGCNNSKMFVRHSNLE